VAPLMVALSAFSRLRHLLTSFQPCQSLFVAPCSHVWHYKCIRKLLNGPTYPIFLCPNCRAVADLEADVEEPEDDGWEEALGDHAPLTPRQTQEDASGHINVIDDAGNRNAGTPESGDIEEVSNRISHISLLPGPLSDRIPPFDPDAPDLTSDHGEPVSNATSAPVPIRVTNGDSLDPNLPNGLENPMTPRNDAGPFILDGGAGQLQNRQASNNRRVGAGGGLDLLGTIS